MSRFIVNGKFGLGLSLLGGGALLISASPAIGQENDDPLTDRTWVGPTSGDQSWSVADNWEDGNIPQEGGSEGDRVIIADTLTGDRTITTPTDPTSVGEFHWTHPSASTGVNTLRLGADFTVDGVSESSTDQVVFIDNQSENAANLVVDLAGFTLSNPNQHSGFAANDISLQTSEPGGTLIARAFRLGGTNSGNTTVGPGVTVKTLGTGSPTFRIPAGSEWDLTSTLQLTADRVSSGSEAPLGNLVIGDPESTSRGFVRIQYGSPMIVRGNMTIHEHRDEEGEVVANSSIQWRNNRTIWVGGDYVDHVSDDSDYDHESNTPSHTGTIVFNSNGLNPDIPRTVNIGRTGLTTTMRVGNDADDPGNIVLERDLSTRFRRADDGSILRDGGDPVGGNFEVRQRSVLDISNRTLNAATFTIADYAAEDQPTLRISLGSETGVIHVNSEQDGDESVHGGDLELNGFILDVDDGGGWVDGSDLTLFTYDGDLSGTPALTLGEVPEFFSFDTFFAENGVVGMTNVVIPEPAAAGLLGVAGLLLLRRRR